MTDIHFKEDEGAIGEVAFLGRNEVGRINFHTGQRLEASWISYLPHGKYGLRMGAPVKVKHQMVARRQLIEHVRTWLKNCGAL